MYARKRSGLAVSLRGFVLNRFILRTRRYCCYSVYRLVSMIEGRRYSGHRRRKQLYIGRLGRRTANHCSLIFMSFVRTPFAPCGCVIVQGKFNDLDTKQRQNLYCRLYILMDIVVLQAETKDYKLQRRLARCPKPKLETYTYRRF